MCTCAPTRAPARTSAPVCDCVRFIVLGVHMTYMSACGRSCTMREEEEEREGVLGLGVVVMVRVDQYSIGGVSVIDS